MISIEFFFNIHQQLNQTLSPEKLPPLQLTIQQFRLNDIPYGNISLKWISSADRLILQYLQMNSALISGTVRGEWQVVANGQQTT